MEKNGQFWKKYMRRGRNESKNIIVIALKAVFLSSQKSRWNSRRTKTFEGFGVAKRLLTVGVNFLDLLEVKTISEKLPIRYQKVLDGFLVIASEIGICVNCHESKYETSEISEMRIHKHEEDKPILN